MRKFWGWMLFLFVIFVARLSQINLSGHWGINDVNWVIVAIWWATGIAALFGWYRLAIRKSSNGDNSANRTQ